MALLFDKKDEDFVFSVALYYFLVLWAVLGPLIRKTWTSLNIQQFFCVSEKKFLLNTLLELELYNNFSSNQIAFSLSICLFVVFLDRVSLCNSDQLETHFVDHPSFALSSQRSTSFLLQSSESKGVFYNAQQSSHSFILLSELLLACMFGIHICTWYIQSPERMLDFHRIVVAHSCEPSHGCWKLNPGPLIEQLVFLNEY